MEFRILGPLEVWDEGSEVSLGEPKPRALLAVLLLHLDEVVPADRADVQIARFMSSGSEPDELGLHRFERPEDEARSLRARVATSRPFHSS